MHASLRDSKVELKQLKAAERAKDAELARKDAQLVALQARLDTRPVAAAEEPVEDIPFCAMAPFTEEVDVRLSPCLSPANPQPSKLIVSYF